MIRLDRLKKYILLTAHGRRGVRTPVHEWGGGLGLISLCSVVLLYKSCQQLPGSRIYVLIGTKRQYLSRGARKRMQEISTKNILDGRQTILFGLHKL
jgi:hypothetical protein